MADEKMLVGSLLIFIEDLWVGAGCCFHACFFHTREELCLLSRVALCFCWHLATSKSFWIHVDSDKRDPW